MSRGFVREERQAEKPPGVCVRRQKARLSDDRFAIDRRVSWRSAFHLATLELVTTERPESTQFVRSGPRRSVCFQGADKTATVTGMGAILPVRVIE